MERHHLTLREEKPLADTFFVQDLEGHWEPAVCRGRAIRLFKRIPVDATECDIVIAAFPFEGALRGHLEGGMFWLDAFEWLEDIHTWLYFTIQDLHGGGSRGECQDTYILIEECIGKCQAKMEEDANGKEAD